MLHGKRIAVVVPAYNEAELLEGTVRTVPSYVDDIIVVDDASIDGTEIITSRLAQGGVHVIRHAENRGVGAALVTGFTHAFAAGADVVAIMAGDGQMHPDDLLAVAGPVARDDADFAKGNRLADPHVRRLMPATRWIGNRVLSAFTRWATGLRIDDSQCGYIAVSRDGAARLSLGSLWPRYGYPNDLLARVAAARLRVVESRVRPVYGTEKSGVRLHHALFVVPWVIWRSARARRRSPGERSLTASVARN
ncbi:MAG: glycosyltransferase family 2 protein [Polyangiales bacterium]|nr:glycosyltransferase family 2 protein [Myxococcales bacterium]